MNSGNLRFQDWVTIFTDAASNDVVQLPMNWLDASNLSAVMFSVHIPQISAVELDIQTAHSPEGPWTSLGTRLTTIGNYDLVLEKSESSSQPLYTYVRWFVDGAATGEICFRIDATPVPSSGAGNVLSYAGIPSVPVSTLAYSQEYLARTTSNKLVR